MPSATSSLKPVTLRAHRGRRWNPHTGFAHARNEEVVPLAAAELPKAAMHLVLAFIRRGDTYLPAALLGLEPGRNLYVSAAGEWLGGYIPELFSSHPFRLGRVKDGKPMLCIDEASGLVGEGEGGETLFDADGRLAPAVQAKLDLLGRIETGRRNTAAACAVMARQGLIQPWPITIKTATGERPVEGLFRIDEAALYKLPAEALLELRNAGALLMAYSQLLSMQHLHSLGRLANAQAQVKHDAAAQSIVKDGELDMEFLNQGGTLSLRGL